VIFFFIEIRSPALCAGFNRVVFVIVTVAQRIVLPILTVVVLTKDGLEKFTDKNPMSFYYWMMLILQFYPMVKILANLVFKGGYWHLDRWKAAFRGDMQYDSTVDEYSIPPKPMTRKRLILDRKITSLTFLSSLNLETEESIM
jgi:hypothetical protein